MAERNDAAKLADAHELIITRLLNVPRALAFSVWTSPEHLVRWWGPRDSSGRDFTTPSCEIDFRPGGHYRICIRSPKGQDLWQRGTYREIVEPERLSFTFAWENDGVADAITLIEVSFDEQGADKTLMRFRQSGLPTATSRDEHLVGWEQFADRLAAYLDKGDFT